ncbi:MAG: 1-deoxy-D-xylulose-5-phosphate synthase [Flavobacteriaceae bacterium]
MSKTLLAQIKDPAQLRKFELEQLKQLAQELRQAIIDVLAQGEGHLGASLGTVEITLALHTVFNTPDDLLIWDVGHQAYGHKMLTGRQEDFKKLRQWGGISGFPKREESPYDAFGTGHAATSISALLGLAISSQLKGHNRHHIAVIGDASIASGMAFEALNHLGTTEANVLVVLNDNSMGIDPSVGALKNYFDKVKKTTPQSPNFFENLGIHYSGPIDGHDLGLLLEVLQKLKKQKGPRLLHIVTRKGKGLAHAEDKQITYHAPGKFDPLTGKLNPSSKQNKIKYAQLVGHTLTHLAKSNSKITAITPAMPTGSGLVEMIQAFPERCFDVGIAEQHAVTLAAGMAAGGLLPFCVIYSTFLQRAYDQVIHDVALQQLPVIFCIDRSGIVGHDGPTHHGVFDLAFLRCIPNLTIAVPRNGRQLQNLLYTAQMGIQQPLAIRYPRGYSELETVSFEFEKIPWGKGSCLKEGTEIAVLTIGTIAQKVEEALKKVKNPARFSHYDLGFVKPLDNELLHRIFKKYKQLICYEEGTTKGGFGAAVLEFAAENKYALPLTIEGLPDAFIPHGAPNKLLEFVGLDTAGITEKLNAL